MVLTQLVLLASAPSLFKLWLFYRRDRWEPEPKAMVLRLFLLGAATAAPVYFLEGWLPGPGSRLYDNFVRVALVEELFKLATLWWFAYRHREFNEPMDGIVYGVAVALGFATVENVLYAFYLGPSALLYRACTSTLAHVGFTGLLGYGLGMTKFHAPGPRLSVSRLFVCVVVLHGVYDLLLSHNGHPLLPRGTIVVMIPGLLLLLWAASNAACKASPFRVTRADE